MNKGDWVVHEDGRVGRITLREYHDNIAKGYHLVDFQDNTFARLTHEHYLKPLDPAVADILTAVKQGE
jgi:hypothetical protein